jgi:UDP-GlcNAc:undecaprenyl-phosphate GlcNAc-1-phosphate transferase
LVTKILWQMFIGILLLLLALPPVKSFYFHSGIRWLYIFLFSFIMAYFFTPFCRKVALKFNIMDRPNWRKIHQKATPLLGGVSVYLAFTISLLFNNIFLPGMTILLIGSSLILVIGLIDDIRPLPALFKFIMQIIISLIVIFLGDIQLTLFYNAPWAPIINIPLTVIWLVGLTNAMNFFDGIDGLASIMSIIISAFLGIIAFKTNQPALGWFSVAMAGSCMGFTPHNFRFGKSARLFLGDAGSTFLGFTLGGLAVLGRWSNTSDFVSLSAPVLIFGVLIFDMTYVNMSRIKNRLATSFVELLTCVNKDHLHHRLLSMGFEGKEVVFVISVLSACLGVSALIIMNQRLMEAILGLAQSVMILGLIAILMLKGRERSPKEGDRRVYRRRKENHVVEK